MTPRMIFAVLLWATLCPGAAMDRPGEAAKSPARQLESPFRDLAWKNLGPTFCGGRVVDVEGYEGRPGRFWAAAATGGLWLTADGGKTWRGSFSREATASIGDIAVSQGDDALLWLGSGESNAQGQSYPGCGIFKSMDAGMSWMPMGLAATGHIARVLIDPDDSDTVYAAAAGSLFAPDPERGVYKTSDGGKRWEKVLFISERTGVIDLAMDMRDHRVLYAATWQRERQPWKFSAGGPESAVYKTADGGKTWTRLAGGLPSGPDVGRIGLAVSRSNPSVVYALVDNQGTREIATAGSGMVRRRSDRQAVDPNERRFDPRIIGAEVYRSADGGGHWQKVSSGPIAEMYHTYGFYFGQVRVAPDDENRMYILGVSLCVSRDGGRSFARLDDGQLPYANALVHRDHHALWIDPRDPRRLILGNDGGINLSHDEGRSWSKVGNLSISQCYTVIADDESPANVFTGTQDNGVLSAPLATEGARGSLPWRMLLGGDGAGGSPPRRNQFEGDGANAAPLARDDASISLPWRMLLGGDGAWVAPLTGSPRILFAAAQFGVLVRFEAGKNTHEPVKPKMPRLFEPYRFNWLAPLLAPAKWPGEVLFAANKVLRTRDLGVSWQEFSPDLSNGQNIGGDTPYATISALAASELAPGLLYAGTDDGNAWVKPGREQPWRKTSQALPGKWVSRIVASRHRAARVYLAMNNRVQGDDRAYIFVSENLGMDWESLRGNLPDEPLNALAEDPDDEGILYLGSDHGLYATLDGGASWLSLQGDLPCVPVTDLFVQRRDKLLLVATFGRGIYVLPLSEIRKRLPTPSG